MKNRRLHWMLLLCLSFASFAYAAAVAAAPMTEQQKIDALIHSVEVLPNAQFIRNGTSHDGKAAADHLRTKRNYAGDRIKTAMDFINCCASKSSMSGQPYQIRFANGNTVDAEVYFRGELKRIETPPPPAPVVLPIPAPIPTPAPVAIAVPAAIAVAKPVLAGPAKIHSSASRHHRKRHHAASTATTQKRPS